MVGSMPPPLPLPPPSTVAPAPAMGMEMAKEAEEAVKGNTDCVYFLAYPFTCKKPPIGEGRLEELGKWLKGEFHVCGNMWDSSSVDIAASGLGWFAIGLMGEAKLDVWTYDGVVIVCNAILPNRSHDFEVAGFTVSKSVSTADLTSNKQPCYWKTGEVGKGEESRNILVKD
ncbi:hypothetical protein BC332_01454 [Capsicum chinense]|nr:hypothetical protein BC332_01454 [Capsicum chinense]